MKSNNFSVPYEAYMYFQAVFPILYLHHTQIKIKPPFRSCRKRSPEGRRACPWPRGCAPMAREPRLFAVKKQVVVLRVDTKACHVQGFTELVISPTSTDIKVVRLHCRQLQVIRVQVNGHTAKFKHADTLAKDLVPGSATQATDGKISPEVFEDFY
eukprot:69468_2